MHYKSAIKYILALENNSDLAILPMQLAADILEVTRPAIDRMLRIKQLEELRIGKTRFVKARSLLNRINQKQQQITKTQRYLEKIARKGEIVFYEPVMNVLGLERLVPQNRNLIGEYLGRVSEKTYAESGIFLSVIVHRKTAGKTSPGPGFLTLAKQLGAHWKNDGDFIEREVKKVWQHYTATI